MLPSLFASANVVIHVYSQIFVNRIAIKAWETSHENYIPGISVHTVDMERFAGLNICGFNPIEILAEILLCCIGQKCLLFSIIKVRCLYSQEKFDGTLENCEMQKFNPVNLSTFTVCSSYLPSFSCLLM